MTLSPPVPPLSLSVLRRPPVVFTVIGIVATTIVSACMGYGLLSIPGIVVGGSTAVFALLLLLYAAPVSLVALLPASLTLGAVGLFYPYQFILAGLSCVLVIQGVQRRAAWMLRIDPIEVANLAFIVWALFTGFWCTDSMWYMRGVRRLLTGFVSFAVAYRLARLVPRSQFELGFVAGALTLSSAALFHFMTLGMSVEEASYHRADSTDLGWGTANYIATLLLLLTPLVLNAALRAKERWLRMLAWPTVGLVGVLQGVVASRAAAALFTGGTLFQVFANRSRRQTLSLIAIPLGFIALFVSPLGRSLLLRFTSLRELGSMTVRIWYFRVAWQRLLDHFPWGMGLAQGWTYPDRLNGRDPHNYWLVLGGELGLLGLLGWIAVLWVLWSRIRRIAADPEWRHVGRALQVTFWLGQLHTLVEPTFQGPQYQFVFFWIMGTYVGAYAFRAEAKAHVSQVPGSSGSSWGVEMMPAARSNSPR